MTIQPKTNKWYVFMLVALIVFTLVDGVLLRWGIIPIAKDMGETLHSMSDEWLKEIQRDQEFYHQTEIDRATASAERKAILEETQGIKAEDKQVLDRLEAIGSAGKSNDGITKRSQ
jgi:hypothetical protein